MKNSDEGMGLSLAIYAIAMACGLALFVLPVIWANSGHVYDNPGVTALHRPGGPVRSDHRAGYPLATLQSQPIVSPAMLAELNAEVKKAKPVARRASRPAPRHYAQADHDDLAATPQRRGLFFFSWF